MFKFRLTDGRMVAQLPSILEGDDAQTAQPTAAEQPAPARDDLAGQGNRGGENCVPIL